MDCSQKLGEDFAKFCGLLRIYELYKGKNANVGDKLSKKGQDFVQVAHWSATVMNPLGKMQRALVKKTPRKLYKNARRL